MKVSESVAMKRPVPTRSQTTSETIAVQQFDRMPYLTILTYPRPNLTRAKSRIKQLTKLDNDAEAVVKAAREFLRLSRLRELKAVSGKVEVEPNWQELEVLELGECGPGQ